DSTTCPRHPSSALRRRPSRGTRSARVRCCALPFSDECAPSPRKRKYCKPAWSYASHVAPAARSLASSQPAKDVSWAAASILSHRGRRGRRSTVPGDEFVVAREHARGLGDEVADVLEIFDAVV